MPSQVNWYEQDVLLAAGNAMQEALLAIAFQIEAEAKVKAPVDTGFMRNSAYVVGGDTNTFQAQTQDASGRQYETATHPEPAPPNGVTVGFAADYTIFVEAQQPFLYPAAQRVARQAGGTIEAVGRRHFR